MSTSVVLPALGESVTEGTVTRWLKQVGDEVKADEGLLEISTDKVDTEIPSPVSGILEEILVQEDETVEVGGLLAKIGDGSGQPSDDAAPEASAPAEAQPPAEDKVVEAPAEPELVAEAEPAGNAAAEPAAVGASSGSSTSVVLPELGESVTEGTVTRWLKNVGDEVAVDEPLLEISTDKVDTEIPSPVAGVLQEIVAAEDETIAVGAVLAKIGSGAPAAASEPAPAPAAEPVTEPAAPSTEKPVEADVPASETPEQAPAPQRHRLRPRTRPMTARTSRLWCVVSLSSRAWISRL